MRSRLSAALALRAAALVLVAALLVVLGLRVVAGQHSTALGKEVAAGKHPQAPAFALPRLGAPGRLGLASLRGRVVVLNFWASWCNPCKAEAAVLEDAARRWRSHGVVLLGVDAQDFTSEARRFVHAHGIGYPTVHDGPGTVTGRYGVTGFPETWFVTRSGKLAVDHVSGPVSATRLDHDIRLALEQ
jgi:cytochrome c biogenesis protein CcmG/thiol:disulfide interchange protein DsbE